MYSGDIVLWGKGLYLLWGRCSLHHVLWGKCVSSCEDIACCIVGLGLVSIVGQELGTSICETGSL